MLYEDRNRSTELDIFCRGKTDSVILITDRGGGVPAVVTLSGIDRQSYIVVLDREGGERLYLLLTEKGQTGLLNYYYREEESGRGRYMYRRGIRHARI